MLSEGVLAADVVWDREVEDLIEVVRFVYQRFADYRIAGALLDQYGSEKEFRAALQPGPVPANKGEREDDGAKLEACLGQVILVAD